MRPSSAASSPAQAPRGRRISETAALAGIDRVAHRHMLRAGAMMARLFETIRALVATDRYVVGQHAVERLEERGVLEWQVVDGLDHGSLLLERPDATPNPAAEVRQSLADGTEVKAVWSYIVSAGVAKLVTVHFFEE
jgi:hypothetical protein